MIPKKKYFAKVYAKDGMTIRKIIPFEMPLDGSMHAKSQPEFSSKMNGGLGELVIDLKAPFDNFLEGTMVDFMNVVDLYCSRIDPTTLVQTTRRIYSGYCSRYEPYADASGDEGCRMTLLGFYSLFTTSYYGTNPYGVTHTTVDPETIAKAIVDNFNAAYSGSFLTYSGTTSPVGTNVTYTFTQQKWDAALTTTVGLAGTGWWFSIDRDRQLIFKAKPSIATHSFTIGKDVESLVCPKDSEKVVNEVLVIRNSGTTTTYTDATSQAKFGLGSSPAGRRTSIINDSTINDATTADQRGNKELGDNKDQKVKATLTVNSTFDIEKIQVGDTCKIFNFNQASTFFGSNNQQIVELTYHGDTIDLQLEEHDTNFGIALTELINAA